MTFEDLKKHYGSAAKAAEALGLKSRQAVHEWKRKGIPPLRQLQIEKLTRGKLRADAL
jgi:hypothetical protein